MIKNDQQLKNTQDKLERLEEHLAERLKEPSSPVLELSIRSLRQTRNQLIEEIVRYQAHCREAARSSESS